MARPVPTIRGSSHDSEFSAGSPRRANAVVSFAPRAAKRISAAQAWIRPMPAQPPLMATITGLGMVRAKVIGRRAAVRCVPPSTTSDSTCMSIPGQNDRPAPVTTTTRTWGSSAASPSASK